MFNLPLSTVGPSTRPALARIQRTPRLREPGAHPPKASRAGLVSSVHPGLDLRMLYRPDTAVVFGCILVSVHTDASSVRHLAGSLLVMGGVLSLCPGPTACGGFSTAID